MRILEFTPPAFLGKARLICSDIKTLVDAKQSIYKNCRLENYGFEMPAPPPGMNEVSYNNLLGGKGCMESGCNDKNASRTHWPWFKRWCIPCWKSKIERDDRAIKSRSSEHGRITIEKLLECIPHGMHDSFMKPHDIVENLEQRARSAPRLYKYYLTKDIEQIISKYQELSPVAPADDPTQTAEQKAAAQADYQQRLDKLPEVQKAFIDGKKATNDIHMANVIKIEAGIRSRRKRNAAPYNKCREARKELFTRRATEEIGHIPTAFVQSTKAYKAATRIFRDEGTERGWQTLKPKIVAEYLASQKSGGQVGASTNNTESSDIVTASPSPVASSDDEEFGDDFDDHEANFEEEMNRDEDQVQVYLDKIRFPGLSQTFGNGARPDTNINRLSGPTSVAHDENTSLAPLMNKRAPTSAPTFPGLPSIASNMQSIPGYANSHGLTSTSTVTRPGQIYNGESTSNGFNNLPPTLSANRSFGPATMSMTNPPLSLGGKPTPFGSTTTLHVAGIGNVPGGFGQSYRQSHQTGTKNMLMFQPARNETSISRMAIAAIVDGESSRL